SESESDRRANPAGDVDCSVSLLHTCAHVPGHQALRPGESRMRLTPDARRAVARAGFSRRDFLKTSGVLLVGFSGAGLERQLEPGPDAASAQAPANIARQVGSRQIDGIQVDGKQVDSWIAIAADGSVTAYTGKCELGQGLFTVQTQLIAEELGVRIDR